MQKKSYLILEDGTSYGGYSFGDESVSCGEVVFSTSMTGYQEMLTDPSYGGQILVPTYPLIGNYGINKNDFESKQCQVSGFVVREECPKPSHGQSTGTVHEYLKNQGIPGVAGIDTRDLVRRLRSRGVMMGIITHDPDVEKSLEILRNGPGYASEDLVKKVTTMDTYVRGENKGKGQLKITILDFGLKYNIVRALNSLGCMVTVVRCDTPASQILETNPDGILFSPGPGDPARLDYLIEPLRILIESKPVMGICLGHQMIARTLGAKTFKLKYGHRGANHPVRDIETQRVYITAQNHGYAIDLDSMPSGLEASHINLNDGTVEGVRHRDLPFISIQYHSEASPGPRDNMYLFERFINMIKEC